MPNRLHRYYGAGYSHFITTSCYQRLPLLRSRGNRDLFLRVLEQVGQRCRFAVAGYVVMPEHVHLLIGEPKRGNPSCVMQAIKQGFARRLLSRWRKAADSQQLALWSGPVQRGRVWQPRFYDFVVFSEKKRVEKLRYMHRNPVKRGLVLEPEQWPGAVIVTMRMMRRERYWSMNLSGRRCESEKSLDAGGGGAQPSKTAKAGAADFVLNSGRNIKAGPAPGHFMCYLNRTYHVLPTLPASQG